MDKVKLLFFICLFFIPIFSQAEHSFKKDYIIGVQNFEQYLPYSQFANGRYRGFNKKLLDLFAKSKGYKFVYQAYPVKRLYKSFLDKKVDFKYPDNPYWNADLKINSNITYSQKVVEYIDGVMVIPKNKNRDISKLKNLAVVAGFTPFPYFTYIKEDKIRVMEFFEYKKMLDMGLRHRVDGVYSNIAVTQYYLREVLNQEDRLIFDENLPYIKSHRYLSTIKYPDIIEEFNIFLKKYKHRIDTLKRNYNIHDYDNF